MADLCRCGEREPIPGHSLCQPCRARSLQRWRENNREHVRAYGRQATQRIKREMVDALGGCCACCGEDEIAFLTLDHIGNIVPDNHRRADGSRISGRTLLHEVRKEGFPRDKYRILCWNCNAATSHGRVCPHELAREGAA